MLVAADSAAIAGGLDIALAIEFVNPAAGEFAVAFVVVVEVFAVA